MNSPTFELKSSQAADILVVEVAGEVDMATSPQLTQAVEAAPDSTSRTSERRPASPRRALR